MTALKYLIILSGRSGWSKKAKSGQTIKDLQIKDLKLTLEFERDIGREETIQYETMRESWMREMERSPD